MKKILFIALFFCFAAVFSQIAKPEVVKITTVEKLIATKIDKYPITLYLKLAHFSEDHQKIYSVKGWYYYDNKKVKISLVGIYDGELTLFHLASQNAENDLINFKAPKGENLWDRLEILKNLPVYEEKFVFTATENNLVAGKWLKGTAELSTNLLQSPDIEIYREQEFLKIKNGNADYDFDLYGFDLFLTGFGYQGYFKTKTETRILLDYEFSSSPNVQGMCGAGTENGYTVLHFDNNLNFLSSEEFRTYSCLENTTSETDPKNPDIVEISKWDGDKNTKQKIKVDVPNAQIIKLKP